MLEIESSAYCVHLESNKSISGRFTSLKFALSPTFRDQTCDVTITVRSSSIFLFPSPLLSVSLSFRVIHNIYHQQPQPPRRTWRKGEMDFDIQGTSLGRAILREENICHFLLFVEPPKTLHENVSVSRCFILFLEIILSFFLSFKMLQNDSSCSKADHSRQRKKKMY